MKKKIAAIVLILLTAGFLMAPALMEWSDHGTVYTDTWKIEKAWILAWGGGALISVLLVWSVKTLKS